ncbi:hypothetical protein AAVH_31251 [Aphelenchoides avenae]|nr:hypothetical protein AAVH_31251 [Aphelenchus avenae]
MAHLPPARQEAVIYIEQEWKRNSVWWPLGYFLRTRARKYNYYEMIGVTQEEARKLEEAATAATDGWSIQTLSPRVQQEVEEYVFKWRSTSL